MLLHNEKFNFGGKPTKTPIGSSSWSSHKPSWESNRYLQVPLHLRIVLLRSTFPSPSLVSLPQGLWTYTEHASLFPPTPPYVFLQSSGGYFQLQCYPHCSTRIKNPSLWNSNTAPHLGSTRCGGVVYWACSWPLQELHLFYSKHQRRKNCFHCFIFSSWLCCSHQQP